MWQLIAISVTSKYGRLVSIAAWLVVPLVLLMMSPSLTEVSSSSQEDFLPVGVESTKAIAIQKENFQSTGTPGILIYRNLDGLNKQNIETIQKDYLWLKDRSAEGNIGDVTSIFDNPGLQDSLLSADQTTMMIMFDILNTQDMSVELIQDEIKSIRKILIENRDDKLEVWLTGAAGTLNDAVSVFQSLDFRITLSTVTLVLIILLLIYRAPLLAIFPLVSAGLAYMAASGIAAFLAERTGLPINAQATAIMVVLIFGAGTDYMLFISSRFKEQLKLGLDNKAAIYESISKIGPAIFSSAATTILAMLLLALATMRSFQILGPLLALGMAFAVLSGLTFIPAMLSLLGRKAYWPSKIAINQNEDHQPMPYGFWAYVGRMVSKRPLFTALSSTILLIVMSSGVITMKPSFDLMASLPSSAESVRGYKVMQESFPAGSVSPTTIYVSLNENVLQNLLLIESISEAIMTVDGISNVTSPSRPLGNKIIGPSADLYFNMDFNNIPLEMRDRLKLDGFPSIKALLEAEELYPLDSFTASLLVSSYKLISPSNNIAKIDVVFQEDPGSLNTLNKIGNLRNVLKEIRSPTLDSIVVGGSTAIQYDTKVANNKDIKVITPIVLAVIFVILAILVRAIIAPLYLLGTVVLSFLGSLGISVFIFQNLLGHDGVGSGVPIFMFLFLVALGVDYNIYIISRVREESSRLGIMDGTITALSNTGGVITSAGIILAGTFATMATLPLRDLFQLGFVVALGVLIDTFFVRGFMVPSFIMLFGKWNWWPFVDKHHSTRHKESL